MYKTENSALYWAVAALIITLNCYGVQSACPAPPAGSSSALNTTTATTITYRCRTGYVFIGSGAETITFTCPYNGADVWGPSATVTECEIRNCSAITTPTGANLTMTGISYQSTANMVCVESNATFNNGQTSLTLTCLGNGQWSAAIPTECAKPCPQLDGTIGMVPYVQTGSAPTTAPSANAPLKGNTTKLFLGTYVRLDCPVGYQLNYGNMKQLVDIYSCLNTGMWSPTGYNQLKCALKVAEPFYNNMFLLALIGSFGGLAILVAIVAMCGACAVSASKESADEDRRMERIDRKEQKKRAVDRWYASRQRAEPPQTVYVEHPSVAYPYNTVTANSYSNAFFDQQGVPVFYNPEKPAITY